MSIWSYVLRSRVPSTAPTTFGYVTASWRFHVVDIEAEASAIQALTDGDLLYARDTRRLSKRVPGAWVELAAGAGGGGAAWGQITGTLANQADLQTALNGKAATAHTHEIATVSGLQAALDGKAPVGHTHVGIPVRVIKTADQANSTQTLANVNDLSLSMAASTAYTFRFVVFFTAAAATTGLCLALNGPAGLSFLRASFMIPTSTSAWMQSVVTAYETQLVAANSGGASALCALVEGQITNGPTPGALVLRFRSEVNASAVTVLRGSRGELV